MKHTYPLTVENYFAILNIYHILLGILAKIQPRWKKTLEEWHLLTEMIILSVSTIVLNFSKLMHGLSFWLNYIVKININTPKKLYNPIPNYPPKSPSNFCKSTQSMAHRSGKAP